MLAYYLQGHMEQQLTPLFKERMVWVKTGVGLFVGLIDSLAQIILNKVSANGFVFYQNSTQTDEQEKILNLLGISMQPYTVKF